MKKLYLIVLVFLLVVGVCFIVCKENTDKKFLSISMNTWPGYEPIVLAKEKGFIGNNVKINRMGSATDVLATFNSGDTDIAFLTLDEVMLLRDKADYPIKIISILDYSNGSDAIVAQSNIKELKELKGKRIGVESTAIGAYLLLRAFELNKDISLSDIEVVQMDYSKHAESFKAYLVDAVATFEPIKSSLMKFGGNVLFDSSSIPNEILDVMVVRENIIVEKNKELKELVSAWFKAVKYIKNNYDDAIKIMAVNEGVDIEVFKQAYESIYVPDLNENKELLSLKDMAFLGNVKKLESILLENKMIFKSRDCKNIFSDEFLPSQE